jgi:hypothetical protein
MPVLKIAAGVVVVVGVGLTAVQVRGSLGGSSEDSTAGGAVAQSSPQIIAPVQSTKTDYAKKSLPTQIKALVSSSQKQLTAPKPEDAQIQPNDSRAADESAAPKAAGPSPAAASAPAVQGQLLRSPAALQACLAAIGAAQVQPVAVDLARYAGREAAIIVLPGDGGGYDVWVVARDCRAKSDGALDFVHVKS